MSMIAELKKSVQYMKDPNVATWKKIVAIGAAGAYVAMPVDVVPDLIPILGQMDDVAVITLLSKGFNKLAEMDLQKNVEHSQQNVYDRLYNMNTQSPNVALEYDMRR